MAGVEFPEEREAPEADAAEQARSLDGAGPEPEAAAGGELPLEADTADAAEQAVPVPVDEDEYR